MIWVRREGNMRYQGRDYYAFRRGNWKLVQNSPFEPYSLYNLQQDPMETTDVSQKNQSIQRMLTRALMDHVQEAGFISWQGPGE
jgi:arylsulfatase A-like enzyme